MLFIAQSKIQIFGKPIGLEIALLEARAALKYPTFRKLLMRIDAGEHPAEDVVFLDNAGQQRKRRRFFEDFAPIDHDAAFFLADGNQRRQAVTSFFAGSEGSNRA